MKAALICTLAVAALAAPAPNAPNAPTKFQGLAIVGGSQPSKFSVNASDRTFWLNKNTTTYCPPQAGSACPSNTTAPETTFATANTGSLSLDVIVPGGQQVYVTKEGQLKFTQAHSAYVEPGSLTTGFTVANSILHFENNYWYACPQSGNAYSIWAASRSTGSLAGAPCLGFQFQTLDAGNVKSQWQYV